MPKRALAVAAASLLPLTLLAAPSAQAAPSCNISTPSKVAIVSPYRTVTGTYSYGCRTYAEFADWSVVHPTQGIFNGFWFDSGMTSESIDWYDWNPVGIYTIRPDGAYDQDWDKIPQNTRTMTVKYGSRQYISTSRSGSTVTTAGTTTRYSPRAGSYAALSGQRVYLQSQACSTCAWKPVTSTTTNRYGKVTFKRTSSTARYWRLKTVDSYNTFGRTSATSRR
ncbi:hypothetical protein ASG73_10325 [Janibacter sp. Soil728]|uniref:hypothetical protein n=1 Tax=Janibacter sp. Soil728 TaxID=1736393 RepID=UPI0006FB4FD6|nr:hypothetical protein [Janibacter sp. Soil728]KRE37980.1 hypothetical protein ASG73_10325 [Janibacter sp. Soil728]